MLDASAMPSRFGNYELLMRLATGGMATVYLARQLGAAGFQRLVVVKRVHPHLLSNGNFYDMFREEARVASTLHHPNVVPVIDVVECQGELLLVMEYVDSCSLSQLLRAVRTAGVRLPLSVVARIAVDTLLGLQAAHEAEDLRGRQLDLVHRDVSPQNIIVGIDGVTRLIDFGIARARNSLTETREGSLKGKFNYMSPEQTKGQPLDARSDLFSAAVVLYEALSGEQLFQCANEFDALQRINLAEVPSLPTVPEALNYLLKKALSRDRQDRYQTAAEFMMALESIAPPAPSRDVAAAVRAFCGEPLTKRREAVQGMLDGTMPPMRSAEVDERLMTPSFLQGPSASQSSHRSMVTAPGTQVSAVHSVPRTGPQAYKKALWIILGGAALSATLVVVSVASFIRGRNIPSSAPAVGQAGSALASAVHSDSDVSLEFVAGGPILSVVTLNIKSVEIRDARAHLVVSRWEGKLGIDVMLKSGQTAHVDLDASSPREIMVTVPNAPAPAMLTSPADAPQKRPVVVPARPATGTELQNNPYAH